MSTYDPVCSYVAPDGSAIDLSDGVNFYTLDLGGCGLPVPENQSRDLPLRDGTSYVGTRYTARTVIVFLVVKSDTYIGRRQLERRLAEVTSPGICHRYGSEGTLYLGRGDGVVRKIEAVYQDGLDLGVDGRLGPSARRIALQFLCPYVFFKNTDATIVPFAAPSGSAPKVNTALSFRYQGTAPAYPVVTLTGPATDPYLQHTDPNGATRIVGLKYTLPSANTIEFDFGIKRKTIRLNPSTTAVDLRGFATTVSGYNTEFFEFTPGSNSLLVKDQAGSPTMTASLSYYEAYESL